MLRRNELRGAIALWLTGLFVAVACSGEGSGPPKVNCPQGFCGPAPVCGEPCSSSCGCCPCVDGTTDDRNGFIFVCSGGCFTFGGGVPDGSGGSGGSSGGTGDAAPDVDCTGVACAPAAICGQCTAACGCCNCPQGELVDIGGTLHACTGEGCYVPAQGDGG